MMSAFLSAILAVVIVSLLSMMGVFAISLKKQTLDRILLILLSFSAGSILATSYFDLLPEALEFLGEGQYSTTALYVILGFLGFFFLERFIYWYHGHVHGYESKVDEKMTVKKFVYLNLIGDGIHNFIDGMIIMAAFLINAAVGLATTVAVVFHEVPQEIGDFGILVYGGFTRNRALFLNFLSALTGLAGVFSLIFFTAFVENFIGYLMALATGGFIYIAASELIPEMQKEENITKSIIQFTLFILGIVLIWSLGLFFPA